ncbi:hypothetical protein NITMOv2_2965 [Nitrospira moscoviensis]|uniref:Uncharacterized protein n=1 Tax=Nitrospira moscoviensis TaxID=42253 RepID=A0A0K2GEI2_NITMO|nr:hypothetical protein NITMOv2_2965 [Nitrospira moscoviensis]
MREAEMEFACFGERFSLTLVPLTGDMRRGRIPCVSSTIVLHAGTDPFSDATITTLSRCLSTEAVHALLTSAHRAGLFKAFNRPC